MTLQPPPGSGPAAPGYGAPGQPPAYGAPGQPPAGAAPGYGAPGQPPMGAAPGYGAPGQPPAFPAPPAKKSSGAAKVLVRILIPIIAIVVLAVGGVIYRNVTGDPSTADVGDCLAGQGTDLKVVDCTNSDAAYTVVGKVADKSESEFNLSEDGGCGAFKTAEQAYWWGESGGNGDVLCLEPKK